MYELHPFKIDRRAISLFLHIHIMNASLDLISIGLDILLFKIHRMGFTQFRFPLPPAKANTTPHVLN